MGRLIDADALIETMKKVETEYEEAMTCPSWWTAYSVISEQPTAYDVEKVVAELEKESDFFGGEPMGSLQKAYYCKGVEKAIDIVRGGVE